MQLLTHKIDVGANILWLGKSVCGVILCYKWTVPVSALDWEGDTFNLYCIHFFEISYEHV